MKIMQQRQMTKTSILKLISASILFTNLEVEAIVDQSKEIQSIKLAHKRNRLLKHVCFSRQGRLKTRLHHRRGSWEYPEQCHAFSYNIDNHRRTYHLPVFGNLPSSLPFEWQTLPEDPTTFASVEQLLLQPSPYQPP